jgi:hypothetical protein
LAIITTAEYNTYAGISGQDTVVAVLILGAQAAIQRHCDVASFDEATYTLEKYDGTGTDQLCLRNRPVTAVSAVKIREGLADATPTTLETNTYLFETDLSGLLTRISDSGFWDQGFGINGVVRVSTCPVWPVGRQNIVVTYTAGYSSGTMPADLKTAMYRLVDSLRGRRGRDPSLQSESMGAYSWTAAEAETDALGFITGEVAALLSNFRRGST